MKVSDHILYGATASAALYPGFGGKTLFFLIGSILIDIDHYIDYLYYAKFKDWRISKMFQFHGQLTKWIENPNILALEAFHTVEFLGALGIVGYYFRSTHVYLLLAGMIFHLFLDLARMAKWKKVKVRALSFIEYSIRSKRMIKSGTHPETIFAEAYAFISKKETP